MCGSGYRAGDPLIWGSLHLYSKPASRPTILLLRIRNPLIIITAAAAAHLILKFHAPTLWHNGAVGWRQYSNLIHAQVIQSCWAASNQMESLKPQLASNRLTTTLNASVSNIIIVQLKKPIWKLLASAHMLANRSDVGCARTRGDSAPI